MPLAGELTVFCGSLVGASIGFLWYKRAPSRGLYGDVGSLALGGANWHAGRDHQTGAAAAVHRRHLRAGGALRHPAGGQLQAAQERIFKMAPLHHHFELNGLVGIEGDVRFWIGALVFALFRADDAQAAFELVEHFPVWCRTVQRQLSWLFLKEKATPSDSPQTAVLPKMP